MAALEAATQRGVSTPRIDRFKDAPTRVCWVAGSSPAMVIGAS
jgi:hypothetical protein